MAGWRAMAGMHDFVVPDEAAAQAFAEQLAEYGFPCVFARPHPDGGWLVMALDEGPYPVDTVGHRQIEAVSREAAAIARMHGGRPSGGSRFDVGRMAEYRSWTAPIEVRGTKARPPDPEVTVVPAPPLEPLALTPDFATPGIVELAGLDDVPWGDLEHAHGPAADVPDLLRELADGTGEWDEVLDELFGDDLLHQGDCYEATAPALPRYLCCDRCRAGAAVREADRPIVQPGSVERPMLVCAPAAIVERVRSRIPTKEKDHVRHTFGHDRRANRSHQCRAQVRPAGPAA
ncbi:hypothetical protein [Nonomuraea sp. B19D2]|uniref:hypothetical protein n=1 Tax=Nonomuraea sp. B19D2 TaxID=3159561 RepID=UPI0032DAC8A0